MRRFGAVPVVVGILSVILYFTLRGSLAPGQDACFKTVLLDLEEDGKTEQVQGVLVSSGFFSSLNAKPMMGRLFVPAEYQLRYSRVVVLSHDFWVQHFNSNPEAVGKSFKIAGQNYTVVGILPSSFRFPIEVPVWIPMSAGQ